MKYDRPVWQLMADCAADLPDRFRFDDVKQWFDEHYPDVEEPTIRAHLIGMSDGTRKKAAQFAKKEPLFQRVSHGEYEVLNRRHATAPKTADRAAG